MSQSKPLDPLPYPVYFVTKATAAWSDLIESTSLPPPVEDVYQRFQGGHEGWCIQTYIQLKRRGLDVRLVSRFVPGQICVTTYDHLTLKDFPFHSYVVVCRHDRGRPEICEQRIVQNPTNILDCSDHLLPYWTQPGLQPRDPSRGTKLERVVFKGRNIYVAPPFKSSEFLQQLRALGITYQLSPDDRQAVQKYWSDYTEADAVLAVRNCTPYDLSIKPPSKLVNAWMAGCPALLGPEPAYQDLRRSELDYIEVRTPSEAIAALSFLKENPAMYQAMVENGRRRAQEFTPDRLAQRWRDLLAGEIAESYERWCKQSPLTKLCGRPAQFVWRAFKHKHERRKFAINIYATTSF